ncbi:TPA: flagellar hook-basal body complex protein FliE [Burkholderia cenocepacia]|uniref:flagellar hook-basal body complex protein FliE n=1 Tax=Burkholderia TaxID=32008 RepID=UPI00158A3CB7|nr:MULTISPECIES: flagellar hook-basal body complex protein FliE [Burkholderia]MBR8198396.1 flagellar hook-basal body complex protein FliE [Burkholderia cenocepacia]HDV6325023.1 flagellar hook-basal body complex protein FliE [Burkholderia cenocepacia]HDV6353092.1 flagellar hook-basal body complex protein FliE [Burkholderia cenocepacia]
MIFPVNPISSALQQIQTMTAEAAGGSDPAVNNPGEAGTSSFASALKASIDRISNSQQKAIGEGRSFELGASNVSLSDVMVDQQKANVDLQLGLQVRNKLVSGLGSIMQISV